MSVYDDYVKFLKKGGAAAAPAPTVVAKTGGSGGGSQEGSRGQSPLEWGIDIISRPMYAVQGAYNKKIKNAAEAQKSAASDAIKSARTGSKPKSFLENFMDIGFNNDGVLEAGWKGLTSTDQADKFHGMETIDNAAKYIAEADGKKYVAPTLDNIDPSKGLAATFGHSAKAVGRGVGGFAVDVAFDPLTYSTLGIVPAAKFGIKALKAGMDAKKAATGVAATEKAVKAAPKGDVVRAISEAVPESPTAAAPRQTPVQAFVGDTAPTGSRFGAANVAEPLSRADVKAVVQGTTAPKSAGGFARVGSGKVAQLPKVSETLSQHSGGVVAALVKAQKAVAEAATKAPLPTTAKGAAKATPKGASPAGLGDFARQFFGDTDTVVAQLPAARGAGAANVFPSTIIKNLSSTNPQAALTYLNRLNAAARNPQTSTPQLRDFMTQASMWMREQKATRAAAQGKGAEAVAKAAESTPIAAVAGAKSDLIASVLRGANGKPTRVGAELKTALGEKIFRQLTSSRTNPQTRERIFDELGTLANDADSLSPATFDGMHENVRHFIEDQLHLTRDDFDLITRQKIMERELLGAQPRLTNPKTTRGIDPKTMEGVSAALGTSPKVLLNRYDGQMREIIGSAFDPKKGVWFGDLYTYKTPEGLRYGILDGKLGTYAFTSWMAKSVKSIDDSLPPRMISPDTPAKVFATQKTAARRAQVPEMLRQIEKPIDESGLQMGVTVGDEFVPMKPSHIFDALNAEIAAARQLGGPMGDAASRQLERAADIVIFNPNTGAPYSLFFDAMGAAIRGADDAAIDAVFRQSKSKYNGIPIKRQPMAEGREPGRYGSSTFTPAELRAQGVALVRSLAPGVAERGAGMAREFAQKTITDAGAMEATLVEGLTAAAAKGDGPFMAEIGAIEKNLKQMAQEYGASGYAVGMAAESIAKSLPPWAMKRAKAVKSNQTAYVNAMREGKTSEQMRVMGAVSEARHMPVDQHAAIDDASRMLDEVNASTVEGDELYGLGTDTVSKLDTQIRSAFGQMVHGTRKRLDAEYGASVDGVSFNQAGRSATGSAAKSIVYRQRDINNWAKQHNTMRLADTKETIGSAAFKLLQQGTDEIPPGLVSSPAEAAAVSKALEELKPLANYFFDVERVGFAGDMYWRSGSQNMRYLEHAMDRYGFTKKYGNPLDQALAGNSEDALSSWWRSMEIDNPAEFLSKYNESVHSAMGQRAATLTLIDQLKRAGLATVVSGKGFKKPRLEGSSFFYAGLDEAGVYVDPRVLEAMSDVDRMMAAARSFGENSLITKAFDPVNSAWKMGMTIMRPGHHVRNATSNAYLAFMDQGMRNLQKSGVLAADILARRSGDPGLAGVSELERLLTGVGSALKGGGDKVVQTTKLPSGKKLEITRDGLFDSFSKRGGVRTFQQAEDILQGKGKIQKYADISMAKDTKFGNAVGGFSEGVDHHGYFQHYIQIVLNNAGQVGRKYKTVDDLYDAAIKRAHQLHPDSTSISAFEAKYLRRVFPFYNWFRATLPVIMETSINNPGRAAVAHKASFNIAQTFGIDAESFANPWPEDADVPDYLKEGVFGPNALFGEQVFTLNPGFAHTDLARDFFGRGPEEGGNFATATMSNAGRMLLGMLNPMLKAPFELTARTKTDGRKVHSTGDYIDESLPYVNYLTSSSGISFMDNLLDPVGAIAQGRPHERSQVDRGYQQSIIDAGIGEHQGVKVLNWLFGQGAQPVDTKDQAAAKKELREETLAAREAGEEAPKDTSGSTSGKSSSGGSQGSSGGKKTSDEDIEELLGQLNFDLSATLPAPAELDYEAYQQYEDLLRSGGAKPLTPSQRMTITKDLQKDDLRRQSAMEWPGYAQKNLAQAGEQNPQLSIQELLAALKYTNPNPYTK